MNNDKITITITLPKRLADKLREVDRIISNHDLGRTLAEIVWMKHGENLQIPHLRQLSTSSTTSNGGLGRNARRRKR